MYFKNVLLPYDGSKYSKKASKIAIDVAKKYNSNLTILNCISGFYTGRWYVDNRIADEQFQKEYQMIKNELKKLQEKADAQGVKTKIIVKETPKIVKKIEDFAKENKIDMIVMGSHGRTGLDKIVLGSVTEKTIRKVNCPVLVVK